MQGQLNDIHAKENRSISDKVVELASDAAVLRRRTQRTMRPEYQANCDKPSKAGNKGITARKLLTRQCRQTAARRFKGQTAYHCTPWTWPKFKKNEIADIVGRWGVFATVHNAMKRNKGSSAVAENGDNDATIQ